MRVVVVKMADQIINIFFEKLKRTCDELVQKRARNLSLPKNAQRYSKIETGRR